MDRIKHYLGPFADDSDDDLIEDLGELPEFHFNQKEMRSLFEQAQPMLKADYLLSQEEAATIERLINAWDRHFFSLKWAIWDLLEDPEPAFINQVDGSMFYLPTDNSDEHEL